MGRNGLLFLPRPLATQRAGRRSSRNRYSVFP